ncbi:MAG: putative oligosaccharide transporter permease protein [Acidimicrobiales bacterium]|nr:putative oligosaccharide transporter permease protein [Acidimicrobiales bacterium]
MTVTDPATSPAAARHAGAGFPLLRILPPVVRISRRPHRMVERQLMCYRRTWPILLSGFFEPLFYLLSIRVGLSKLVGTISVDGHVLSYAEFVAPAMMAASAMNGAVYDSTMNVFHKLKYARVYDAVLATPMTVGDVALGEIVWALIRGVLYSTAFLVTMAVLGLTSSWWILASVPICVLIGFAFAAVGMACTSYMRGWTDFEWVATVTMPLFLFSATFYPLASYGPWRWVVQLSPLYHGVALVRAANAGVVSWGIAGHVAFLLTMAFAGLWVVSRRLQFLLLK